MARRIRWAERAAHDLVGITEHIAQDAPTAARRFAKRANAAARSLAKFPKRGRPVPELRATNLREVFLGDYRLIYRIESEAVAIVALIHGARGLEALWERERRDRS